MFLRVMLSHLVVVLLCLMAGAATFDALFGTGVRYFLVRDPILLVPVMLILMGVAGLLAVWTTAGMSRPLESMTDALDDDDPVARLAALSEARHTAESRQLLDGMRAALARVHAPAPASGLPSVQTRPLVELDAAGIIVSVSPAAAALVGSSPLALVGHAFTDIFAHDQRGDAPAALLMQMRADVSSFTFTARLQHSDTAHETMHWHAVALRGMFGATGSWMLRPVDASGAHAAPAD